MGFRQVATALIVVSCSLQAAPKYFGHEVREDEQGVIAPWYPGLNGQCDLRVRIAAETLKRYPWTSPPGGKPLPDYIYNGRWSIDAAGGKITPGVLRDWGNGDLVQRGTYSLFGLIQYYRYSGDPAAIAHIWMIVGAMLDRCQTGPDHDWPSFIISVPNAGEPYGQCNEHGMIQLDLAAMAGLGLVQAYEVTGEKRWLDAATHWANVLAQKRNRTPGEPPWNRYANPQDVFWNDRQTGGVLLILRLFDELIRIGKPGEHAALVDARDAGRAYLRDQLLPRWLEHDTWGRDYWDWDHSVQSETLSEMVPRYFMQYPDEFPDWRTDARNIMSLFLTRACVSPDSNGGVFSGAWAYPEGSQCCGRSLDYPPMQVGAAFAEYGVRANSAWAREMARRQFLLATYDAHPTGVVEDNMDGGQEVAGAWFQCAHPLPLAYVLDAMGWLPDVLGASRENHIMRTSSIVSRVTYAPGRIEYRTFDAPSDTVDVLRLAFKPLRVSFADRHEAVPPVTSHDERALSNGDWIVTVRHDGWRTVIIEGTDPQRRLQAPSGSSEWTFEGNQVRVIGAAGNDGGLADVYIDGTRQLCGIDAWNPYELKEHVLFYANGLAQGSHVVKVVPTGRGNPLSNGRRVAVDAIVTSAATGDAGYGQGGGPTDTQRWIFGYPGRQDYLDTTGQPWRPATEVVIRSGDPSDAVSAWHIQPRRLHVESTHDPVLYRHGMHGKEFTAFVTVGPGSYHVRVKLMETRVLPAAKRAMDIRINAQLVAENIDIAATAVGRPARIGFVSPNGTQVPEGLNRAVDMVFNDIKPSHGVIAVQFTGRNDSEAVASALEVGPGPGGIGANPIPAAASQPTASAPLP